MAKSKTTRRPTILNLCKTALYIGAISYGGPAVLAQAKKIVVHQKNWLTEKEFLDGLSLAQILPGATGINVMGYVGYRIHKIWGGILAPLFYVLPAVISMMILAWAYFQYGNLPVIQTIMLGLGALVVALLCNATLQLGQTVFKKIDTKTLKGFAIALLTFAGAFFLHLNVIWLVLLAGILGVGFYYFTAEFEDEHLTASHESRRHAKRSIQKFKLSEYLPILIALLLVGGILLQPRLREIFTTFFGIGAFSFGGGFIAIPLIQHQIVDQLHWLSLSEFRDGIALGQVTPGPVFITATFIGYKVLGVLGAFIATLAVFTPALTAMMLLSGLHAKV
ncbi:MAG: chromate efflux transporter, partial [Patescibacteria group bacterium]